MTFIFENLPISIENIKSKNSIDSSWIFNMESLFIRHVIIGKYAICEIPNNGEEVIKYLCNTDIYLYTGHSEWLELEDYETYNIEYKNKIYNVWFCKVITFDNMLKTTNIKQTLDTLDTLDISNNLNNLNKLEFYKNIKTNIKKCNIINARCNKSMEKLDDIHRIYVKKHNFVKKQIIAIKSVAGSGKTTTLLDLAKIHKNKKILYLAFNKSLIQEIKTKLKKQNITNLIPSTFDALMRQCYMDTNDEPNIFDLKPTNLGDKIEWFTKKPFRLKSAYVKRFNDFCNQIVYDNIEDYCINTFKKKDDLLIKLWVKILTNEFQTFDSIRKLVQINHLCKDYIDNTYDLIFIDEAQDFDNVMLKILLEDTNIPKLFVGDPKQAIYEWRGSINAFNKLPKNTVFIEFYSTFRIGNPACNLISKKFDDCWMISKNKNETTLEYNKTPVDNYVYLFRTWKNLLLTAQRTKDIWIYNYDKQKVLITKLHEKLLNFTLTEEEQKKFEDDLPVFLCKMTTDELNILLDDIDENLTNKSDSICHMYTIHSYKGLEDNIIKIYNDIDLNKEQNLYYVALTRGIKQIIQNTEDINLYVSNISTKCMPIESIEVDIDIYPDINQTSENINQSNIQTPDTLCENNIQDINKTYKTLCEHNITMKTVKKKGGICEGKLQIKISGNKIINKSGIRTLHCSDIDEGLLKISKILNIKKNNIFLV
jgi:hypothetical protein